MIDTFNNYENRIIYAVAFFIFIFGHTYSILTSVPKKRQTIPLNFRIF